MYIYIYIIYIHYIYTHIYIHYIYIFSQNYVRIAFQAGDHSKKAFSCHKNHCIFCYFGCIGCIFDHGRPRRWILSLTTGHDIQGSQTQGRPGGLAQLSEVRTQKDATRRWDVPRCCDVKGSGIAGSQQVWMITMIAPIHMIHPDPINIVVFIFNVI